MRIMNIDFNMARSYGYSSTAERDHTPLPRAFHEVGYPYLLLLAFLEVNTAGTSGFQYH